MENFVVTSNPGRISVKNTWQGESERDDGQALVHRCVHDAEKAFPQFFEAEFPQPETRAEHFAVYQLIELEVACLEELGYEISVPTFGEYIKRGGAWTPYDALLFPTSEDQWEALNRDCPQDPWAYEELLKASGSS